MQLHLAASFYGEAGGQFTQTFTFTNVSQAACRLSGWPRIGVLDHAGRNVVTRTLRVVQNAPLQRPYGSVVLRSRGAASFDLFGADWNFSTNRPCARAGAVRVEPPGTRTALAVRVDVPNCGRFYIAPVVSGRTDRRSWSVVWRG